MNKTHRATTNGVPIPDHPYQNAIPVKVTQRSTPSTSPSPSLSESSGHSPTHQGDDSVLQKSIPSPRPPTQSPQNTDDRKTSMTLEEFYSTYDPVVGIRTAAILGGILVFLIFYIAYKQKCKERRKGDDSDSESEYSKPVKKNMNRVNQATLRAIHQEKEKWILLESLQKPPKVEISSIEATAQWIQNQPLDTYSISDVGFLLCPDNIFPPSISDGNLRTHGQTGKRLAVQQRRMRDVRPSHSDINLHPRQPNGVVPTGLDMNFPFADSDFVDENDFYNGGAGFVDCQILDHAKNLSATGGVKNATNNTGDHFSTETNVPQVSRYPTIPQQEEEVLTGEELLDSYSITDEQWTRSCLLRKDQSSVDDAVVLDTDTKDTILDLSLSSLDEDTFLTGSGHMETRL